MSLKKLTFDTAVIASTQIFRLMAQFLVVPVLARFLSPADYGVVSMAMPFVLFAMMFADAGVGSSLVRDKKRDDTVWSTCFWLTVLLGVGLMLVIMALGPLIASIVAEPRLTPVLLALATAILLQAIGTVPGIALRQEHRFCAIAVIEIIGTTASIGSAFATAIMGWGAWALVIQQLVLYAAKLVLTLLCSMFRPRLIFRAGAIREHLIFGRDVLGSNFVLFLFQMVNNMLIGSVAGTAQVGIYSMSMLFAGLPQRLVTGPLQFVAYPHFANIRDKKEVLVSNLLFMTRVLGIVVLPGIAMVAVVQEPAFRLILSAKWEAAGHVFLILAPAVAVQTITALLGTVLMSLGRTDLVFRQAAEMTFLRLVALLLSVRFGIEWIAFGYTAATFLYFPRALLLTLPSIGCPVSQYLHTLSASVGVIALSVGIFQETRHLVPPGDLMQCTFAAALMICNMACAALLQTRQILAGMRVFAGAN